MVFLGVTRVFLTKRVPFRLVRGYLADICPFNLRRISCAGHITLQRFGVAKDRFLWYYLFGHMIDKNIWFYLKFSSIISTQGHVNRRKRFIHFFIFLFEQGFMDGIFLTYWSILCISLDFDSLLANIFPCFLLSLIYVANIVRVENDLSG